MPRRFLGDPLGRALPGRLPLAANLTSRLQHYHGLPVLRRLPPALALLILHHIESWLRHLHQHQRRWTSVTLPSVPLLSSGELLVIWNTASPQLLLTPPPDLCWHYHASSDYLTLTLISSTADPVPQAILWAPTCPTCGRPQPLTGHLLTTSTADYSSAAGVCCWSTPPGRPLTASAAARASVAFAGDALQGVLPVSLLRRSSCTPPRTPPPLPPYNVTHLEPRPRTGAGRFLRRHPSPPPTPPPSHTMLLQGDMSTIVAPSQC